MTGFRGEFTAHPAHVSRRDVLRLGLGGLTSVSLAQVFRARAEAATRRPQRSVILICLGGGPSHLDLWDLKPEAPEEIRGEFSPIATRLPGWDVCELMPGHAQIADKLAIVRSLKMIQPDHQLHECFTGFPTADKRPSFGSVASRYLPDYGKTLPTYISLSLTDHPRTAGVAEVPTYLGQGHAPFEPSPGTLENLERHASISADRLQDRQALRNTFDRLARAADRTQASVAVDRFTTQALDMLTSPGVRAAFDISQEPESIRRLYGDDFKMTYNYQFGHTWPSTQFLMARRLVEAGVPVVTISPGGWDHHGDLNGVRGTIFERSREQLPLFDRSLTALITDLDQRGMLDDVCVLVWGEFGRTPKVNRYGGRDHWPAANCALFAGGGLNVGQVIGATDAQGAQVVTPPYNAQHVHATLYRVLGIDPALAPLDFSGRPRPLLDDPRPIRELVS